MSIKRWQKCDEEKAKVKAHKAEILRAFKNLKIE